MGRENYYLLTNLVSEEEKKVLTSIISHIEHGDGNVGIQQIANENYISPASIVKFCQRLGYGGYRELFYHLATQVGGGSAEPDEESPLNIIDNYSEDAVDTFCTLLAAHQQKSCTPSAPGLPSTWPPTWCTGCPSVGLPCSTACTFTTICCSSAVNTRW